jgi:hypothetical protein
MHAVNLHAMMVMASQESNFDNVAILDNDLIFLSDFIGWAMKQGGDLVGNYMGDRREATWTTTSIGNMLFVPKFSVWHLVMSNRFFRMVMDNEGTIFPFVEGQFVYDTFSKTVETNKTEWQLPVTDVGEVEISKMVQPSLKRLAFHIVEHKRVRSKVRQG